MSSVIRQLGKETLSSDGLHERYEFTGFYMVINEE